MILRVVLFCIFLMSFSEVGFAKNDYIYRNRINWVKLEELSKKQLAGVSLLHPAPQITTPQMEAMLLSLKMNKASVLKSDVKTQDIFDADEAAQYAPLIVKALNQASPQEVIHVSLVHQRNKSILRNDHLSMMNIFVTQDGLHFYFSKLFAKLDSDYLEVSKMDQTIRNTKSARVSLEALPGQVLAYGLDDEIILDLKHDFLATQPAEDQKVNAARSAVATKEKAQPALPAPSLSTEERLKNLDNLKEKGLVSDKEYKAKKKEILNDI